ncbi:uncharacterized protein SPAPADRAFT_66466 [Spathaspora passalidarum NRRL Y-27907]|uniref:Uncharacterized protein n=1 Tax=Spathaspora passalidarum (strain NRRL Y-27907 / 11-Y1) TaxID=619300 RepID=G3AMR5_SPAPN|nr:uncharacterized protein SPAPADRAFT_66466 [Spathaspora passalidarum NRRL Y-27907]EGW33509.1 hypothetical protein SPAPADRAFT_66466 [Spathaspora passalidarum NRRL Y-27907]
MVLAVKTPMMLSHYRRKKIAKLLLSAILIFILYIKFFTVITIYPQQYWYSYFSNTAPISSYNTVDEPQKLILFPRYFPSQFDSELQEYYSKVLGLALPQTEYKILRYENSLLHAHEQSLKSAIEANYTLQETNLFNSLSQINEPHCSSLNDTISFEVSEPFNFDTDLYKIVNKVLNSEHLKENRGFNNIRNQIKAKTINKHWFRFVGNSVYLEDYGVHLMVSRVSYTPSGRKERAFFSFSYAQIFDEAWNEITDIELIVPTNNLNSDDTSQAYMSIKYPSIVPIPTYKSRTLYKGPEDPRVILVKSRNGYMEPVIIFNAYGQVLNPDTEKIEYKLKRYMFLSWLWQTQQGKLIPSESRDSAKLVYCKTVSLKHLEKFAMEKNWTPMLSFIERQEAGHDINIYIVYRWSKLEILKCSLEDIQDGNIQCNSVFQVGKTSPVGRFRGGTSMVNINMLLDSQRKQVPQLNSIIDHIPKGREIWFGFARAHLEECGCGESMYRPNIVVLVKDQGKFKITHVSPFVSLNIPMLPWDTTKPNTLCLGRSVVIPNGISQWMIAQDQYGKLDDYLTLAISRADVTVDLIHIRGLFSQVLNLEHSVFKDSNISRNKGIDIVECALDGSKEFCKAFGEEREMIESSMLKGVDTEILEF